MTGALSECGYMVAVTITKFEFTGRLGIT